MKKVCFLLIFALVASMAAIPALAEGATYSQAPMLDERVASGELPPVAERLPAEPFVVTPGAVSYEEYFDDYQIGQYGGTLRSIRNSATWDGWIWCIFAERAIETVSGEGKDFYGNVIKDWEVSEDFTTYKFYMREGLRWSDGELLTTEDVAWKFDMDHANQELTATWPNWLRTGNSTAGTPCTIEVHDEYTFTLTFDDYYPGFILRVASHDVYEMLAPAHYLKDFHIDTADKDELTAKCAGNGYTLEEWFKLYELYDYSSWDIAAENQIGSPSLGAWIITKMDGSTAILERNPYYWKVDAEGQQLPYVDYMTSTYAVDAEAIAVKILAGEVDYTYEWIPLSDIGLYAGSAEKGDYKLLTKPILHRTGADLVLNWTYDDPLWRGIVNEYDFRAALCYAIDYEEIADSVYFGFAEPATMYSIVEYDVVKAGELLDGIGMTVGADGWRTYPDGSPCILELAYSGWMTTYEPTAVLVADYLRAAGLNIQMKFVDNDLMDTLQQANDLQMSIQFSHGPVYITNTVDFAVYKNACNYYLYDLYNGASGEEPNEIFAAWYDEYLYRCMQVAADDIADAHAAQIEYYKDNLLYVMPVQNISQPSAISNRLVNFPSEGGYNLDACRANEDVWVAY
ncbi:MAG: ABC transporter substrate-binding protein [Christensenellales bacterium]